MYMHIDTWFYKDIIWYMGKLRIILILEAKKIFSDVQCDKNFFLMHEITISSLLHDMTENFSDA